MTWHIGSSFSTVMYKSRLPAAPVWWVNSRRLLDENPALLLVACYFVDVMPPRANMTSLCLVFLLMLISHVTTQLDPSPQGKFFIFLSATTPEWTVFLRRSLFMLAIQRDHLRYKQNSVWTSCVFLWHLQSQRTLLKFSLCFAALCFLFWNPQNNCVNKQHEKTKSY